MGRPKMTFLVRFSGAPLCHQIVMKAVVIPDAWETGVRNDCLEPNIKILTYETLREKLVSFRCL